MRDAPRERIEDGPRAVRMLVEISDAGRAPKNDPALLVLALALMLTKAIAYGAPKLQQVPVIGAAATWIATGKHAVWLAGLSGVLAAGYDALINGGSWTAALFAASSAFFAQMHSTTQPQSS